MSGLSAGRWPTRDRPNVTDPETSGRRAARRFSNRAFTLIELLVVIAIIAILAAQIGRAHV